MNITLFLTKLLLLFIFLLPIKTEATLPPTFVENKGQLLDDQGQPCPEILGYARMGNVDLFLRDSGISYVIYDRDAKQGHRIDLEPVGGSLAMEVSGTGSVPGIFNFYNSGQPNGVLAVNRYSEMTYKEVWPGVDWVFQLENGQLKHEFRLAAGADPSMVRLLVKGADGFEIGENGSLQIRSSAGNIVEAPPISFQFDEAYGLHSDQGNDHQDYLLSRGHVLAESHVPAEDHVLADGHDQTEESSQTKIPTHFSLRGDTIGFEVNSFDPDLSLIIDPVVSWSGYLGGSGIEVCSNSDLYNGISYMTGWTGSTNFPTTTGAFQTTYGPSTWTHAFASAFDPNGTLIWSTFYGGSDQERANSISAIPSGGCVFGGWTLSNDFPVSFGAFQTSSGGVGQDGFLVALGSQGQRQFGTYIGGTGFDAIADVDVGQGNMFAFAGRTSSSNFPTTSNAFMDSIPGNAVPFFGRMDLSQTLHLLSFFGGSLSEEVNGVALFSDNRIAIAGDANSYDLPVSPGAFQDSLRGSNDGFVAMFDANGGRLWATYFGGSQFDSANDVAISGPDGLAICGKGSSDLPLALNSSAGGGNYVARIDTFGQPRWSSFHNGTGGISDLNSVACGPNGQIYTAGQTSAADLPVTPSALQDTIRTVTHEDGVLAAFDTTGSLLYSTYYGGSLGESFQGTGVDSNYRVLAAGFTNSWDFPILNFGGFGGSTECIAFLMDEACLFPVISNSGPDSLFPGDSLQLTANSGYDNYTWSTGDTTPGIWVYAPGNYSVTVTNNSDSLCIGSDVIELTTRCTMPLSGTYTIGGTAPNFMDFSSAVEALTCAGVNGPVEFLVRNGSYQETIEIINISGVSANNTVTFRSESGDSSLVILWSDAIPANQALVNIDLTGHVSFEGMTLRNITLGAGRRVYSTAGNCPGLALRNCRLEANPGNTQPFSLSLYLGPTSLVEDFVLTDCHFLGGFRQLFDASTTNPVPNYIIERNVFDGADDFSVWRVNGRGLSFRYNRLVNTTLGKGCSFEGLQAGAVVSHNYILGTLDFGGIDNPLGPTALVANNFIISDTSGILLNGTSNNCDFLFNNVLVTDPDPGVAAIKIGSNIQSPITNTRVRSNNFTNTGGGYTMYLINNGSINSSHNNHYGTGQNLFRMNSTDYPDLAAWTGATTLDIFSLSVDPGYVGPLDLHISNPALIGVASLTGGVVDDFDGELRPLSNADIGADEIFVKDLAAGGLILPFSGCELTNAQTVEWLYQNVGDSTIMPGPIPVGYQFNLAPPVLDTAQLLIPLGPGDLMSHVFQTPVDLSMVGTYDLKVFVDLGDISPQNDTNAFPIEHFPQPSSSFSYLPLGGLNYQFSVDIPAAIHQWDFGDGSPIFFNPVINHTFPNPGIYTVCLTVTNGDGCVDSTCQNIDIIVGVDEPGNMLSVYPNPADDWIRVAFATPIGEAIDLDLYDLQGRKVYTGQMETGDKDALLPVSDLAPGVYALQVRGVSWNWVRKISVQ